MLLSGVALLVRDLKMVLEGYVSPIVMLLTGIEAKGPDGDDDWYSLKSAWKAGMVGSYWMML